jgi:uncharacterized protein DUF3473
VGGGGYFRLLPEKLIRSGIGHVNRTERRGLMFYFHPWELDPGQPRVALPWWRRWRQYQGLRSTEPKLRRLLSEFSFVDMSTALSECDLDSFVLESASPATPLRSWSPPARARPSSLDADEAEQERRRSAAS